MFVTAPLHPADLFVMCDETVGLRERLPLVVKSCYGDIMIKNIYDQLSGSIVAGFVIVIYQSLKSSLI